MKAIMTVNGPVEPEAIGVTMMHEHLCVDLSCNFVVPEEASLRAQLHRPVTIEMLGLLRRRPFSVTLDNVVTADEEVAIEEVGYYHREGGETIVDCTSIGIGRDPRQLYRIARASGVNVVMGSGCYLESSHPSWVRDLTADELAELFVKDVLVGVDGTGIRSGIIGEIGTSGVPKGSTEKQGDITPEEEKVLRGAARAARRTGLAVSVHLDLRGRGAFRIVEILDDEGVPRDRQVMGHMDLVQELDYHREVAALGVVLEYDSLGREYYSEELGRPFGHDTWRVEALAQLVSEGFADQLVAAQDVCLKIDLRRYGGYGFAHVLASIVPMLRRAGVADEAIAKILVDNPRRILAADWDDDVLARSANDVRQRRHAAERVTV